MKIKEMFNRDKITSAFKRLGAIRFKASRSTIIQVSLLFVILLIAFIVRLLPIRWGFYLSEFDPYYQYRLTKYLVENGFHLPAYDYMRWYPWGDPIARNSLPGLPSTAATLYTILNALGVPMVINPTINPLIDPLLSDPVYNLCVIFPVIMGTITCLVIYFLGRDLGGEEVGIFAALFLALDSSYIGRTSLGFFDDETVGIFGILLFLFLFLRSIDKNRPLKTGLLYAIASGLSLGYICSSWGAARYPIAMTALFAFFLLVIRRYSTRLFLSYGITFGITLSIAMIVPFLGYRFLLESWFLPVYGVFILLSIAEIRLHVKTLKGKIIIFTVFIGLCAALIALLWIKGMIEPIGTKWLNILNPLLRAAYPLIESVAEHRPSAWGTFYYNFGIGLFFLPIGLFFATLMATNWSIFLIIYGLTSIYFASSMIRLNIVMTPAVCLLWALALVRLLKPFILILKESPQVSKRRLPFKPRLGKEFSAIILIMMFILLTLNFVVGTDFFMIGGQGPRVYQQADSPTTIASASMPLKPSSTVRDWIDTLIWMRNELPPSPGRPGEPGTVVACWWDYGYWISIFGNKTTLADNGTINMTQIEQIAFMFMSDVNESIKVLKEYNVTHVVVFTTVYSSGGADGYDAPYGEFGKFKWMIRIAQTVGNWSESDFGNDTSSGTGWEWSERGKNTTLYLMMTYGKYMRQSVGDVSQDYINRVSYFYQEVYDKWAYFTSHFELVYYSKGPAVGNVYALVLVYEVKY